MRRLSLLVACGLLVGLSGARPVAQTSTWRPVILSDNGMVASGHALASEAGLRVLKAGGNAVDAAVAAWAVQGVTEPEMTGLGGDMFMLIYLAKTGEVKFINGTRRGAAGGNGGLLQVEGWAAGRWRPVGERTGRRGRRGAGRQDLWHTAARRAHGAGRGAGRARLPGHRVAGQRHRGLARQALGLVPQGLVQRQRAARNGRPCDSGGPRAPRFGRSARRAAPPSTRGPPPEVRRLHEGAGGLIDQQDLAGIRANEDTPLRITYKGVDVYECPPNSQGFVMLQALNILEGLNVRYIRHNSAPYLHAVTESLKLAVRGPQQVRGRSRSS